MLNYEEGSEAPFADGDGYSEATLTESGAQGVQGRNLAAESMYREGAGQPKMMLVGLHMRLTGHPSRAVGLERFLDYVMTHKDVWICRREEIARHWIAHHPATRSMTREVSSFGS